MSVHDENNAIAYRCNNCNKLYTDRFSEEETNKHLSGRCKYDMADKKEIVNNYKYQIKHLETKLIPKKWGYEEIIYNGSEFCSKILQYNKRGSISSLHFHPEKKEVFRVIKGSFNLKTKNEKGYDVHTVLKLYDTIYIPNNTPHQLESLEDNSEILEISTFHDDKDVVRIAPGDSQL